MKNKVMKKIKEYLPNKRKKDKLLLHIFKRFLLQHHCYETFRKEYNEGYRTCPFSYNHPNLKHCSFSLFLANIYPKAALIYCAFLWGKTAQGDHFWFKLSSEWVSFCRNHNI